MAIAFKKNIICFSTKMSLWKLRKNQEKIFGNQKKVREKSGILGDKKWEPWECKYWNKVFFHEWLPLERCLTKFSGKYEETFYSYSFWDLKWAQIFSLHRAMYLQTNSKEYLDVFVQKYIYFVGKKWENVWDSLQYLLVQLHAGMLAKFLKIFWTTKFFYH